MQSSIKPSQIEEFIQQLIERKSLLEQQQPVSEKLEVSLKESWGPIEKVKVTEFSRQLSETKQVVRMEIAIYESIKDFVDPSISDKIKEVLCNIRDSNNLRSMNGVYHAHRNDVKVRQVIKLVNAVYRYNRNVIYGYVTDHSLKSIIKHATSCPHCGEISAKILKNMEKTKAVFLPA